jgi:hypothetical protein
LSEAELTSIIKGKGPGVVNIEMFKVCLLIKLVFCAVEVPDLLIEFLPAGFA